jgi:hypothetical protein
MVKYGWLFGFISNVGPFMARLTIIGAFLGEWGQTSALAKLS